MNTNKTLSLFNTLTKKVESFQPISNKEVKIYCCGPTVYLFQHIGNFRTFIFEDVLVRSLRVAGYNVKHVMNITDVGHLVSDADDGEDKMLVAARREKKKSHEIAEFYTQRFFEDSDKLNIVRPSIVCKATDHIQEMVDLTKRIEQNGFAYFANGNVYYDVDKDPNYGKLANLNKEALQAGARIEVDVHKRSPHDFVLWFTKSKFENQELQWDSPWGSGYPGWHIECSAMAMKYLGEHFDIHCGGIDHIPVHHTNEIAQSEAAISDKNKPWVNYWLHAQFLTVDGEKMSKSKGNLYLLKDFEDKGIDPLAFRYLCLSSHYRSHLNFSWETVNNAASSLTKLKKVILNLKAEVESNIQNTIYDSKYLDEFNSAIFEDLSTTNGLAILWKTLGDTSLNSSQKLSAAYYFDKVLGLGMEKWLEEIIEIPENIKQLVLLRETARKKKDWKESDRLRDEVKALGFLVEDKAGVSVVKKV